MEYLEHFVKSASLPMVAFVALAGLISIVLIPVGIWIVLRARGKSAILVYLCLAFLPLLICLTGAGVEWAMDQDRYLAMENPDSYISGDRADYVVAVIIGILMTTVPFIIGIAGLFIKKRA